MQANVWNILDSCAFFTQMHPDGKLATVVDIENEIVNRQSKQYYSNLVNKDLKIIEPSKESIELVEKKAIKTGSENSARDKPNHPVLSALPLFFSKKREIVVEAV